MERTALNRPATYSLYLKNQFGLKDTKICHTGVLYACEAV